MGRRWTFFIAAALVLLSVQACFPRKIETVHKIEVQPMHITIDVNVKVDKALDAYFGDLDKAGDKIQ